MCKLFILKCLNFLLLLLSYMIIWEKKARAKFYKTTIGRGIVYCVKCIFFVAILYVYVAKDPSYNGALLKGTFLVKMTLFLVKMTRFLLKMTPRLLCTSKCEHCYFLKWPGFLLKWPGFLLKWPLLKKKFRSH